MVLLKKSYLIAVISMVVEWCLFILLRTTNMGLSSARDVPEWLWGIPVYLAAAIGILLVANYGLDSRKIRTLFKEASDRDRSFNYIRGPSLGTIFFFSVLLLFMQWISFSIWWLWGAVVQATILFFLLARLHDNAESSIDKLRRAVKNSRNMTIKNQAFRAYHYKYSAAATILLIVEINASSFVVLERLQYGFYDRSFLVVLLIIGLVGGVPIYFLAFIPYLYHSKKGGYG